MHSEKQEGGVPRSRRCSSGIASYRFEGSCKGPKETPIAIDSNARHTSVASSLRCYESSSTSDGDSDSDSAPAVGPAVGESAGVSAGTAAMLASVEASNRLRLSPVNVAGGLLPNTGFPSLNSAAGGLVLGGVTFAAFDPFVFFLSSSRFLFSASTALTAAVCCVFTSSRFDPLFAIDSVNEAS